MEAISNDDILVTQVVTPIKPDLLFCMSHLHVIFIYSLFVACLFVCFTEIPAKEEVLPMCCVPQCHHDTRAWRAYSV